MRKIALLLLLLVVVAGCTQHPEEKGIVAKVNGEPIYLKEMEARYDLNNLGWVSGVIPSVETMRSEYGSVLSELIVYKFVGQALAEEGLSVDAAAVQAAEDEIRSDYPDDLFERSLTEEYIDIEVWRLFLKRHLELKLFLNDVLRPRISIPYQEAEAYYKEHLSEFYLPERVHFLLVTGANRDELRRVSSALESAEDWSTVPASFPSVTVRELKLRRDRLPAPWAPRLQALKAKRSSNITVTTQGFEQLVMLSIIPEKVLGPSQAYPLIERILIEQKLNDAFSSWLKQEVAAATIEVTPLLSEKLDGKLDHETEESNISQALKETEEEPAREPESDVGKSSDP